jgi:RNA polymerase-binding transcription factor DksA
MKKDFKYNELSNISCDKCGKRIKKNVLSRKPNVRLCYRCGVNPSMNSTARDVHNNPSLKRKQLYY